MTIRARPSPAHLVEVRFELHPQPPFRLDLTAWALRRRRQNLIDTWDGHSYRRALLINATPLATTVTQVGPADRPRLEVVVAGTEMDDSAPAEVERLLHRLLGLDIDLTAFYIRASSDDMLGDLVERYRGVRPPRFPTIFECLLNAVACQQLSIEAGMTLLGRLAAAVGAPVGYLHAFPTPESVLILPRQKLRRLGFSNRKVDTILGLADAASAGELELNKFEALDDGAVIETLQRHSGIGPWSADYVLLRGLGRLHVFPRTDVGALNGLRNFLEASGRDEDPSSALARWSPDAGLVYFHLLLRGLERSSELESPAADQD
jgi:DNA-3-methyladenine glycosylase II